MFWSEEQILLAKKDFRVFLFIVWKEIGLPDPTPVQYDIGNTLQNPPSDRFILEGFRGVAKSFITCAYAVWRLWKDPQLKVLIVSASKDRADANAIFIKRIIQTVTFLNYLLPRREQRDTQNIFDVSPAVADISPSVKSVGITGQITGSRADLLIGDDVEVPNNSSTQVQRDKLSEAIKEFDAILKPGGQIIYLGTPQTEMSIYNTLQDRGYKCIIYPVVYPESQGKRDYYADRLAPFIASKYDADPHVYAGLPTDPKRFNEEEIAKRKLSYGKAGFALQFELNTNLSDSEKYPLKVSDLIIDSLDIEATSLTWAWSNSREQRLGDIPCVALKNDFYYAPLSRSKEIQKYTSIAMFIDPSGRGTDQTAYAVLAFLNGYIFLLDVDGFKEGYSDYVLKQLAMRAKFFGCTQIFAEPNFGDGMFTKLLTPIVKSIHPGCSVEDFERARGQKEARIIDTLEPVMMRHRLIVDRKVIEKDYKAYEIDSRYSLIYQMTRLSKDKGSLSHDDKIEVVSMGVGHWVDSMSIDEQTGFNDLMEEQLERWLDPDYGILYVEEKPSPNSNKSYDFLGNIKTSHLCFRR